MSAPKLTLREIYAGQIMAGLAVEEYPWSPREAAAVAVQWADALIAALKEQP
jgi:hypothetical protein